MEIMKPAVKHILCYGDSNTFGFDGRKMADGFFRARYDRDTRWTGLLSRMLGEGYEIIEEGMGGVLCANDRLIFR